MARIRSIKPDFWTDEKAVELSAFARLLFIGLWNFADDEGRMVYSQKKIKMQIFPSDSIDISELFGEIRREKMIDIYVVDNIEYLQVINFAKHQKIDKRTASKLPPNPHPSPESPRIPPTEGKGRDQGREGIKEEESNTSSIATEPATDFQRVFDHGASLLRDLEVKNTSTIHQWLNAGCDVEKDIIPTITRLASRKPGNWGYFTNAIMDAKATRERPPPEGTPRHAKPKPFKMQNKIVL